MNIEIRTTLLTSCSIILFMGLALLVYSLAKKRNRIYLWAVMAALSMAVMFYLMYLRNRIPDFYSIVVANAFAIVLMGGCYEAFRSVLSIKTRLRIISPIILLLQTGFIYYFTMIKPSFSTRVFIVSCSMTVMIILTGILLARNWKKGERTITLIAFFPYFLLLILSVFRILLFIFGSRFPEDSYNSQAFAVSTIFYSIVISLNFLSLFFIANNRQQNQLTQMALIDPLTGVLNRRAFMDALERETSRAKRTNQSLSAVMIDLDHFKSINDRYGHQAGDAILAHTVNIYKNVLRSEDILARFGGEEFIALFPSSDMNQTLAIAERMRHLCETEALTFENHSISVTASFGVAEYNAGITDSNDFIKQADEALYAAKKGSRNTVIAYHQNK